MAVVLVKAAPPTELQIPLTAALPPGSPTAA